MERDGLAEICIKVFWRKPLKKPNSAWGWRPAKMTRSGEVQYGLKYSVLSLLAPGITFEMRSMIEMYDTDDLILVIRTFSLNQFSHLYLISISSIIIVISSYLLWPVYPTVATFTFIIHTSCLQIIHKSNLWHSFIFCLLYYFVISES